MSGIRQLYNVLVPRIHILPTVVYTRVKGHRSQSRVLKKPLKKLADTGRWSLYSDSCMICGTRSVKHWKVGVCQTCKYRIREMEGYARRLGKLKLKTGKYEVIFYMTQETTDKVQALANTLGCNRTEIEEMSIDFLYEFLNGMFPKNVKQPTPVNGEVIIKLIYRLRAAIILEGTKQLSDSLTELLEIDKDRQFKDSYIPGYQQVGGAILTSISNQEKL